MSNANKNRRPRYINIRVAVDDHQIAIMRYISDHDDGSEIPKIARMFLTMGVREFERKANIILMLSEPPTTLLKELRKYA